MTASDPRVWVAEARARAGAATEGPWIAEEEQDGTDDGYDGSTYLTGRVFCPPDPRQDYDRDDDVIVTAGWGRDAAFIAAARTDLPKALDALRAVLDECDRWDHVAAGRHIRSAITASLEVAP